MEFKVKIEYKKGKLVATFTVNDEEIYEYYSGDMDTLIDQVAEQMLVRSSYINLTGKKSKQKI